MPQQQHLQHRENSAAEQNQQYPVVKSGSLFARMIIGGNHVLLVQFQHFSGELPQLNRQRIDFRAVQLLTLRRSKSRSGNFANTVGVVYQKRGSPVGQLALTRNSDVI